MKVTGSLLTLSVALLPVVSGCAPRTVGDGYQPSGDSEVIIDQLGIPHIYGESDQDVFFASGYVLASMRMFQIDLVRRRAVGRSAEVLGASAFRDDIASRAFGFRELGKADRERVAREHPREAELVAAFVTGINRYLERVREGSEPMPVVFSELSYLPERFSEDEVYAIGKMLSFGMSSTLDFDILATLLSRQSPRIVSDLPLCMPVRPAFAVPQVASPRTQVRERSWPNSDNRTVGRGLVPRLALSAGDKPPPYELGPNPDTPGQIRTGRLAAPYAALGKLDAAALSRYQRIVPEMGSNNWAVAGQHSENGRPLLAGDPHQPLSSPLRFFAQHLSSAENGGSLDVIGFSFAGTPGVQLGHNRKVAWTATTAFADVMDLWDVEFTQGGKEVLVAGKPRQALLRTERIRVRRPGFKIEDGEVREVQVTDVPGLGVLLPDELLPVPKPTLVRGEILLRWTGFAPTTEAAAYLELDRAGSVEEVDTALRRIEVGAVNLVYADEKSISYQVNALIPDRGDPATRPLPWRVLDGRDQTTLWSGAVLSDDKLPRARDPQRGYLATANNDPWGFTADGRVDNDPFYYGFFFDPGDRAARIEDRLSELVKRGKVTPEDMGTLQNDAYSQLADDLLPPLGDALLSVGTDESLAPYRNRPELFTLFSQLAGWDRQVRRDSSAALAFFAFAHFAVKRAFSDELGPVLYAIFQAEPGFAMKPLRLVLSGNAQAGMSFLQEGRNLVLVAALADTVDWLKSRFGALTPARYTWKAVHGATFAHPLGGRYDGGIVPVDGSIGTVNVSSSTMFDGSGQIVDRFLARQGPIYRMVSSFDEDGTPRAQVAFPRGNSEDPDSPHFNDQTPAWLEGKQMHLPFRRADVEGAATRRYVVLRDGGTR